MINNIDEDYVQIDNDLTMTEIAADDDIVNDIMTSKQVKPDNDTNEFDDGFRTVRLLSEGRAILRTLKKLYYIKYKKQMRKEKHYFY